jgi:long-chain acyl-CoA synthetase
VLEDTRKCLFIGFAVGLKKHLKPQMLHHIMLQTVSALIESALKEYSQETLIIEKSLYRRKKYTYQQVYDRALSICTYFIENKIKTGDKVVIYLPNSSDYVALLWACGLSGVIAVPIDFSSNQDFLEKIYKKVGAKLVFCSVFKKPKSAKCFFVEEIQDIYSKYKPIKSAINKKISPSDIFEIVFTSGTTSEPKGVVLTNENLYFDVIAMRKIITLDLKKKTILSILPLSHLFEQNIGLFCLLEYGISIIYSQSKKSSAIIDSIQKEKVNLIVSVPLFLQTLKEKIEFEAQKTDKLERPNSNLKKFSNFPNICKRIIFSKIRRKLGNLKYFVVGGAELPLEVEEFWENLGIEVFQGYGLTEASHVVTCNSPKEKKRASMGKPLENIEIKLQDKEILVRGKNLFKRYYEDNKKTAEALKNGWFYTGDLGSIDNEGFLSLIGRKKNVIISSSGLNVYPEDIEKVLSNISEVKECVVLGLDQGKRIVGVIIPKKTLSNKEISLLLQKTNSKLQSHQIISDIIIWPESEFPKTHTLKIKRSEVEEIIHSKTSQRKPDQAQDKLITIISEICKKSSGSIKEKSNLVSLGLDSIKRIELSIKIEEAFNINFNESGINEKSNVADLRNMIKNSKNEKINSGINLLNSRFFNILRIPLQVLILLLSKLIFRLEIRGLENLNLIKNNEPVIFAANHTSMLDTFAVYRALPFSKRTNTFAAAAKDFFFKNYLTAFFARLAFNAFAFSRKENIKQSLTDFGEIINRNSNVLIYPEGTRSRKGNLLPFKEGIGIMALNTEASIIPIKIKGNYEIMPVGKIFPRLGKKTIITFGKPLNFTKIQSPREIIEKLHHAIKEL